MGVRLAFSVAASLESEILFVDEVLAVGDLGFQRKCLGKIEQLAASGRTVVFVSHSVATTLRLCRRVLLFDAGRLVADGPRGEVMRAYLTAEGGRAAERVWSEGVDRPGGEAARLRAVRVRDSSGDVSDLIDRREAMLVDVEYRCIDGTKPPAILLRFCNEDGLCLFSGRSIGLVQDYPRLARVRCRVPGELFAEGLVRVHVGLEGENGDVSALETDAVAFQVIDGSPSNARSGGHASDTSGVIRPQLEWEIGNVPAERA
jgi:lipopolysaccharide transport system ATP-binding protein